jgi:uncharacterized protein (TIGR03437 family)
MMLAPRGRGCDGLIRLIILLSIGVASYCQTTYTINTIAGTDAAIGDGGPATAAQLSASGVAVDSQNNIYVLDGNHIRRIDRSGIITTFFTRDPHTSPFGNLSTLTIDSTGNLYVGDTQNPTLKFSTDGTITTLANVSNTSDSMVPDGVTGFFAIGDNSFVGRIGADGTDKGIYAGQFPSGGFSGDGGPATQAALCGPVGLAVDSQGNLYISEGSGNRIRKVSLAGTITTVAGSTTTTSTNGCSGGSGSSGDGGAAASALLSSPAAMTLDNQDNLYFYDVGNARIRKITASQVISTYAVLSPQIAAGYASQPYINGLAFDRNGNLLLASGSVWSISPSGTVTRIAGTGSCCSTSQQSGPATSIPLNRPLGVAADGTGSVYIADGSALWRVQNGSTTAVLKQAFPLAGAVASDHKGTVYYADFQSSTIKRFGPSGTTGTYAGTGNHCSSPGQGDNGPATSADLCFPFGLSVDSKGNLFFIDEYAGGSPVVVRRVSTNGIITTVVAGSSSNALVEGGPALSANLYQISAVAADSSENIYLTASDATDASVLLKVTPDGTIHTLAGAPVSTGIIDPPDGSIGTKVFIESADGVAVSPSGDVYFGYGGRFLGAFNYDRIVQFLPDGTIRTVAGGGGGVYNGYQSGIPAPPILGLGDGGPATQAPLSGPQAMDIDPSGNIYFVDFGNDRVRMLTPAGAACSYSVTRFGYSPNILEVEQNGGPVTLNVLTAPGCSWAVSGLPSWITIQGNTTGAGPATVNLTVGAGSGVPRTSTISVAGMSIEINQDGGAPVPLTITTASPLQPATTYSGYSLALIATGGSAPYSWLISSGSLPSGLKLSASGTISGTPTTAGLSIFTITVTDATGAIVTKVSSLSVYSCTNTAPPVITSVNSASGYGDYYYFASGSWLEINGTNLADPADPRLNVATNPGQWTSSDFSGVNAPTSLDGISVSINGKPAYVWYLSPTQLNVQAPEDTANGNVTVTVTSCQATSQPFMAQRLPLAPGLLAPSSFNVGGAQYMVATFASDGAYVLNTNIGAKLGLNSRPAKPGDVIIAYGIGFGDVTPSILPGVIVQQSNTLVNPVTISFGPNKATVSYAGLAGGFIGLYEFYFTVPPGLSDADYKINVTQNGSPLPQALYLSVQN